MRTFGRFNSNGQIVSGEVRGDDVHLLAKPYWLGLDFTGATASLRELQIDLPVAPGKLIAVGLNYADHTSAERRSEAAGAHEPDDLFRVGNCLLRQSIDHTCARRPHFDRHAFRGGPDSRGR